MGFFEWEDENGDRVLRKGNHEAIISPDQFKRVQLLLGKRGRPTRVNTYDFPFRGPFTCGECGCAVTAEQKLQCICTGCKHKFSCKNDKACTKCGLEIEKMSNPSFIDKTYYRCTKKSKTHKCQQGSIEQDDLAKAINKALLEIEIDQDFYHWAKQALKEVHRDEVLEHQEASRRVFERKDELIKRAEKLVIMRADGELTFEEFKGSKLAIEKELDEIDRDGVLVSDRVKHWVEIADGYLTFAENASNVFNTTTDLGVKREIVQTLGSNLTIMDKKASIILTAPLVGIKNAEIATYRDLGRFEPKKALDKQGLSKQKRDAFELLCAGLDSNQRRPKPIDLQSIVIDHSTTDACM